MADNEDSSRQMANLRRKLQRGNQDMADLRLHLEEQVGRNAELEKKQRKWVHCVCLIVSWAWWSLPMTWLTNYYFSVLYHCWLGHLNRPWDDCSVSRGTLDPSVPIPQHEKCFLHWHLSTCYLLNFLLFFCSKEVCMVIFVSTLKCGQFTTSNLTL